jgi:histidinol-phosphatase (PHP family)
MSEPSRLLPSDNHVHTQWSWDTGMGASMEGSCLQAIQLGLPAVAFTEHVDFTGWGSEDVPPAAPDGLFDGPVSVAGRERVLPLDVEGYLAGVEKCRSRFGSSLRILSGIEAGEPHLFAGSLSAVLATGTFDRVLGSLHSVVDSDRLIHADRLFGRVPADEVMRRYLTGLLDLVTGSEVFQVLAHCDYPRRYWPAATDGDYDETRYEEEYRAVFRALASSGRALEFNTRSPLWSAKLVVWWREEGGDAVSFGSDAHHPLRVGARFGLAVDIVEAAGFRPGRDRYDFWRR